LGVPPEHYRGACVQSGFQPIAQRPHPLNARRHGCHGGCRSRAESGNPGDIFSAGAGAALLAAAPEQGFREMQSCRSLDQRAQAPVPGTASTSCDPKTPPARTEACSIADIINRSKPLLLSAVSSAGLSAIILASVPPDVNTTLRGSAPTNAAIRSRACSMRCL